ncbi:diguanylate cyclase domain-containing protein [Pontibacterium sp.]|uniref:sensor domain-containing diguanylate cyclase n=1 Tax=Pontibacterium sp. TaxID=2036026 RepID=UPI003517F892
MERSETFLSLVLDELAVSVAVVSPLGDILYVNRSWVEFGRCNGEPETTDWLEVNYLTVCKASATAGDQFGMDALKGIQSVIEGGSEQFSYEYPCHSPDQQRWFLMLATPIEYRGQRCCVIVHQNITERHLAEERVLQLSCTDGLTKISNRRYFEEFFQTEWKRCMRLGTPISLILFDVDHFKLINDQYGHPEGDNVLRQVARCADRLARRPGDICARYGGEEFVVALSGVGLDAARAVSRQLLQSIEELGIPNVRSPITPSLTISCGVASAFPERGSSPEKLIKLVDKALYSAKKNGRNQICTPASLISTFDDVI